MENSIDMLRLPKTDMLTMDRCALVEGTMWAAELSFNQIRHLVGYMDVYQVPAETVLFREGDQNAYLVFIAKGEVAVIKSGSGGTPKPIARLGQGKTIGEMSLIDGQPRSASAVTATESTLMVITASRFEALIEDKPRIAIIVIRIITALMSQYLRQTSGRLVDYMENEQASQ